MLLKIHRWGPAASEWVVCVHGLTQHGRIFGGLGRHLASREHSVAAVDLRGHGESGSEPPWNTDTHVADLEETLDSLGATRVTLIGHSFGGRMCAAFAARHPQRVRRLVLLEPGLEVTPERALRGAEIDRLDWSFATVDGAINALLSSDTVVAASREVVADYVRDDVSKGPDGRFRFSFLPPAVVVAWSEMALPAPSIAEVPTLVVISTTPLAPADAQVRRYREALGGQVTIETVPNGHNMLWESPRETIAAIERFFERTSDSLACAS